MRVGTLIIFVKAPEAGQVKTRLAREVGAGRAAVLFRIMMARAFNAARQVRSQVVLAIEPPSAIRSWSSAWPRDFARMPQSKGDLGARMKAAMEAVPGGPVVVIGTDAPTIRAYHLRQAFRALATNDAVFGPAADGGYWLIGLARRKPAPGLFCDIRWSSPYALSDTLESLPKDFTTAFLETLQDVDDARDLGALGPLSAARGLLRKAD